MRTLRLAQIATEAEALRWRRRARGVAARGAWAAVALPFLLAGFIFLEAAFWMFLVSHLADGPAALVAGAANLLLGVLLALPALLRPADDPVAREAIHLRRQAVAGIEDRLRLSSAAIDLIQTIALVLRRRRSPPL